MSERTYTEADIRAAFRAGWHERNRNPGLKRVERRSLGNALNSSMGGGRFNEHDYVRDSRTYHASLFTRYMKGLNR